MVYHDVPYHQPVYPRATFLYSAQTKHKAPQLRLTYPTNLSQDGAPCSHGSLTGWSARIRIGTLPGLEGWGCRDVGPGEDGTTAPELNIILLISGFAEIQTCSFCWQY